MPENESQLPVQGISPLYAYGGGELIVPSEKNINEAYLAKIAISSIMEGAVQSELSTDISSKVELDSGRRSPEEVMDVFTGHVEGELTAADALVLIDAGNPWPVLAVPERFIGLELNHALAERIIDVGGEGTFAVISGGMSGRFKGFHLGSEVALKMLAAGQESEVSQYIDNFDELDVEIAYRLVDLGLVSTVKDNIGKFAGLELGPIATEEAIVAKRLKSSKSNRFALVELLTAYRDKQGVQQVINEHPDWNIEPSEAFMDDIVERAWEKSDGYLTDCFIHQLYPLSEKSLQQVRDLLGSEDFTPYPYEATDPRAKDRWFGDMSYVYMSGGFNKAAIGRVIRLRLEQGIEATVHDASQWMSSFKIPETAYDTQSIIRERKQNSFSADEYEPEKLHDAQLEREFFGALLHAEPALRQRLNLSSREGTGEQLFYAQPEFQLLYKALVSGDEPLYRDSELQFEVVKARALEMIDRFATNSFGHGKEETTHDLPPSQLRAKLESLSADDFDTSDLAVSVVVSNLKEMGRRRTSYVRDTQSWLQRHATSPHWRLTKVWTDRGQALLHGVADNARAIEVWQEDNALGLTLRRLEESGVLAEQYGLNTAEVMNDNNKPIREELLRVYSADDTIRAVSSLKKWRQEREWGEKILPEATIPVVLDEIDVSKDKPYRFDIIGADDPRGFTIGKDTGCCMTISGASRSCIDTGYTERNAGFVAMYTPSGDLAAQSFWYVHPEHTDTLVLDNIEANNGRDMEKVIKVYQKALDDYLSSHPETGIVKVNVGTGYTKLNLSGLREAESVPPLNAAIYTDAIEQRRLIG